MGARIAPIIAIHPWELWRVKCHILPFCWFWNGDGIGLIYRAGFSTEESARRWAVKQGILDA